jgi:hypothetical protein
LTLDQATSLSNHIVTAGPATEDMLIKCVESYFGVNSIKNERIMTNLMTGA